MAYHSFLTTRCISVSSELRIYNFRLFVTDILNSGKQQCAMCIGDVVKILLLHTNESYAETLAHYVSRPSIRLMMSTSSRVPVPERLRALLAREYDLIQTDELIANGMLATGASVVFDIPLVVAIRGWADYTNAHGQYGWLKDASIRARTRLALHRASGGIFISDTTSETFRKRYPVTQHSVIGRPVDTDRYGTGRASDRETFDLLTVTNLRYEEKYDGVLTVLRALRPLFEAHPTLRYRVAGGGQYLEALTSTSPTTNTPTA